MAVVEAGHRALVGGLELVVELLDDPRADLVADGLDVHLRRDALRQPHQHSEVLHVGPDRVVDSRVLDLDRDRPPAGQLGPVDLADGRRRDRLRVELARTSPTAVARGRPRSPCASTRTRTSARRRAASRASPGSAPDARPGRSRGRRTTSPGRASSPRPSSRRAPSRSAPPPRAGGAPSPPRPSRRSARRWRRGSPLAGPPGWPRSPRRGRGGRYGRSEGGPLASANSIRSGARARGLDRPGRGYSDFHHIGDEEEPSAPQSVGADPGDHRDGETTGRTAWRSHPAARPERRTR